jgi:hypothetical protein
MARFIVLATKLHNAASRKQKERACLEITNPKLQSTKKSSHFWVMDKYSSSNGQLINTLFEYSGSI